MLTGRLSIHTKKVVGIESLAGCLPPRAGCLRTFLAGVQKKLQRYDVSPYAPGVSPHPYRGGLQALRVERKACGAERDA